MTQDFEVVEVTTDLLIIGPGMAGSGAGIEAAHWAKQNNIKVTIIDSNPANVEILRKYGPCSVFFGVA